ncbi:hypothetical protein GCM10022631_10830 [Deinococcus rubellus]|uniref:hypothetical protein n=1 Tax=Deinococcus rubellus TaxID=1889240 RepID=UPI0031EAD6C9
MTQTTEQLAPFRPFAKEGYEAYAKQTGGKTFDGRDMPTWEQLPENIKDAWSAGAEYVLEHARNQLEPIYEQIERHANIMNGAALVKDLPVISASNFKIGQYLEVLDELLLTGHIEQMPVEDD